MITDPSNHVEDFAMVHQRTEGQGEPTEWGPDERIAISSNDWSAGWIGWSHEKMAGEMTGAPLHFSNLRVAIVCHLKTQG